MRDQPFHHTPDHFAASLAIQTHRLHPDEEMRVWGHDRDGAYRQLPWTTRRTPTSSYTHPKDPRCGATVSSSLVHQPACGETSETQWSRCPEFSYSAPPCAISTIMVAPKSPDIPTPAFKHSRTSMARIKMKPSKPQAPARSHKILGVHITIEQHDVVLTPCPQRVQRMHRRNPRMYPEQPPGLRHSQEDGR